MSHLDDVIASLLRNVDDVQRCMAITEAVKAKAEEAQAEFEAVGMEGKAAEAAATVDWLEGIYAESQQALSQIESQVPFAESLKTAGGGAIPGGGSVSGSASEPEYVVTTGADPKPNPVHATPAHTREPSRKIGDPVKPVETEPKRDVGLSRLARAARQKVRDAEDAKDSAEEMSAIIDDMFGDVYEPWSSDVRTETHTAPVQPQIQGPQTQEPAVPEVIGTFTIVGIAAAEGCSRIWERYKQRRQQKREGLGND